VVPVEKLIAAVSLKGGVRPHLTVIVVAQSCRRIPPLGSDRKAF